MYSYLFWRFNEAGNLLFFDVVRHEISACHSNIGRTPQIPRLKIFCVSKMYRPLPWISLNCRKGKNSYLFFDIRNRCFKSVVNFLCFENIHPPPSS